MKAEELFRFVHSMTRQQKLAFARSLKGGKKTLDFLLYERILREEVFSKAADKRIRGRDFLDPAKYYIYRGRLKNRILGILLEGDIYPNCLAVIRIAIDLDIPILAEQAIAEAIKLLVPVEDFLSIKYIGDYCSQVKERTGVTIKMPEKNYSPDYLNLRLATSKWQCELLSLIKRVFASEEEARFHIIQRAEKLINNFEPATDLEHFRLLKIQMGIQWLHRSWRKAMSIQESIAKDFLEKPSLLSDWEKVKETSILVSLAGLVNDRSKVSYFLMKYSQMELSSVSGRNASTYYAAKDHIFLGQRYSDIQQVEFGLNLVEKYPSLFDNVTKANLLFFSALAFFAHEEFSLSLSLVNKIDTQGLSEYNSISWEPDVLILLLHFELGDMDIFESLLRRTYRITKDLNYQYPRLIVSTIKHLSNIRKSQEKEFLMSILADFENIKGDFSEKRAIKYWDFTLWIKSRLESVSQSTLIERREQSQEDLSSEASSS